MKKAKPELSVRRGSRTVCPAGTGGQRGPLSSGEREAFYRLLFDGSNDAILFHGVDAQGFPTNFVEVNETACRRLGYSREELLCLSPKDIDDPASTADMREVVARLRTHERVVFERVHVAKDGRRIPVEISARLLEMDGRPMVLSIARDISERKAAEARVRLANEQLEAVFANVQVLMAYMDADFNFVRVNRRYAEADGKEPEFFIGKNHFALYPDAENQAIFRQVVESGEAYHGYARPFQYPDRPESGITYWDWTLSPMKDREGRVTGLILTLVDVTENRLAWLALEENQKNLSAMFEAISESVLLMDLDGRVLAINRTGARRLKRKQEEVIGANLFDLIPPHVAAQRRGWVEELRRAGKPMHVEDERHGVYFAHSLYPVFDASGKVARFVVYAVDVTERRQLEMIESLLSESNQQVLRGEKAGDILAFICAEVTRLLDFPLSWIGQKMPDGTVRVIASAGEASEYEKELEHIGIRWDDTPQGRGPVGKALRTARAQVIKVGQADFRPWREAAGKFDLQAVIAIPLIVRGEIYGAFTLYSRHAEAFDNAAVVQRLSGIGSRICVALETAMDQEKLRLLGAAVSSASNAIFITGHGGRIRWVNAAFTRMSGYGAEDVIGQTPRILKSSREDEAFYRDLWQTILNGKTWSGETVERHKNGGLYTVQQTIAPIFDDAGEISHFVSIHEDITSRKRDEERIKHLAQYDGLTDLPNRALFYDRLQQSILQARRNQGGFALLYLDLDRFKAVNDSLGHHIGDLLLQFAAYRLKECVRESDTVARLGGDEFAILLHEIGKPEDATRVARKVIAKLLQQFQMEEHIVNIGTSIGIAIYGAGETCEADELVRRADAAMYEAKKAGGGRFHLAPPA